MGGARSGAIWVGVVFMALVVTVGAACCGRMGVRGDSAVASDGVLCAGASVLVSGDGDAWGACLA